MLECCGQLGFTNESPSERLLAREVGAEDLDRDFPPQAEVLRQENDAHSAAPDQGFDPVPGEFLPHAEVNGHFRMF